MKTTSFHMSNRAVLIAAAIAAAACQGHGQELIYQEGFNTDGEKSNPQRYTFVGRDVYEVPRVQIYMGAALIIAACLWAAYDERRLRG